MNFSIGSDRRSATLKVVIGLLILTLLIPVSMVRNVVYDRIKIASAATIDIRNAWGGQQTGVGPILRLPIRADATPPLGIRYVQDRYVILVANDLDANADVSVEQRYRGIHKVPVFTTGVKIELNFDLSLLEELPSGERNENKNE